MHRVHPTSSCSLGLDLLGRPPIQSVWRPRVCGNPGRKPRAAGRAEGASETARCSHDDARLHRPGARVHCLRVVEGRGHSHPWRGEFSWSWSLTVWQAAPVFIVHASPPCFRHPAPSCPGLTPPPPPRALARAAAPTHESAPPESVWHALLMPSGAFRPRTRTRPRTTTAPLQTTLSRTRRTASSRARSTSTWSRTHTMCVPACLPPPHPRCLVLCPFSLRLSTCAAAPSVAVADCDLTRAI